MGEPEYEEAERQQPHGTRGHPASYIRANINELKSSNLYFSALAELLATTLFVFLTTRVATTFTPDDTGTLVATAFVFGLTIGANVWIFGPISGGHFNPAVTFALASTLDITFVRAVLYIIMQVAGSLLGALLNYGMTPNALLDGSSLGSNAIADGTTTAEGFAFEFVTTFFFIFTIMASVDPHRGNLGGFNALWIGIAGLIAHLVSIPYTGTGINPARSFGPNAISSALTGNDGFGRGYWIYWVGPITAALFSALVYNTFFCSDPNKGLLPSSRIQKYDDWKERMAGRKEDGHTLFETA
eukprot:Plantae.Rhodophyta-Purpureofilum_apyrenoidigerum.ctg20162.p2 GENE.Plantae.Rhodophyta-Purpureofilum_apyrenoidigerum.ctg20162~~Plantae.Rhodophyta-Purpureofilum_apyrenoidigerum.ctg20162.p2  ORF type:complete len:321 (+),score=45.92 Plantae.Rhodophyta-Purpureofilum_apyrenoidigerum.ctg20162:65-964(+)